ncbi:MAG: cytochrome c biogenesis protein ResB, partial [Planctomycetia bacterium]|nr:cytochrome c biogenesis protein ResB [Planctomycetia bacterium]
MSSITAEPEVAPAGEPVKRTQTSPLYYARKALKAVASLQLTVVLFSLGILLIFFGTLAQIDFGIWTVVDKYFWSWVVWVPFDLFHKFGQVFWKEAFTPGSHWKGEFPFPGGILLGAAMVINLLAAHIMRFRITWKRSGILLIHSGILLLFLGEFITREYAIEQRMTIDEGRSVNFTEDTRNVELAIIDKSPADTDRVTVIPQKILREAANNGHRITHPELPVDVEVGEYMVNSTLEKAAGKANPADSGFGKSLLTVKQDEVSGVDPKQKIDTPAAYVTLFKKGTQEKLGTYLVGLRIYLLGGEDEFELDGKKHGLVMRFKRYYKPYSVHLDDFRFDRYMGTEKPKNFSSDVRVIYPDGMERQQKISMNDPMRLQGETFYQSSFDETTETTTILQVVRNPGWLLPYISCVVVTLGLLVHFGIYLVQFLTRRPTTKPTPIAGTITTPTSTPAVSAKIRYLHWIMLGVVALYLLSVLGRMNPPREPYDLATLGQIPVTDGGRVKPLDTVARVNLRMISGREEFEDEKGKMQPAIRWYLDVISGGDPRRPSPAWKHKVFRIDNEQVLRMLELEPREGLRYSFEEIGPKLDIIQARVTAAERKVARGEKLDTTE